MEGTACDGQSTWSTEGETRLRRGRLIYGGGDSSTEGETRLQRGDRSTEGKIRLWRESLFHKGRDSSTKGKTLLLRVSLIPLDGGTKLLKFACCFISSVLLKAATDSASRVLIWLVKKRNTYLYLLLTVTVCFIFLSFRFLFMWSTIINLRGDEGVKVMQNCCKNL